jgi:radical SAM protein with 4Fe4S-binding SPASM domain
VWTALRRSPAPFLFYYKGGEPVNTLTSLKSPISVNLETTQVCNLRCGFCFSNSATYHHKNPPLERVKRVIDALAEAEVLEIRWFGGEFTALRGWEEAVAYASARDFFMAFVSNGTLMTRKSVKTLVRNGVTGGAMSVHGPETMHDQVVGVPGAFRRTIAGMRNCLEENIGITVLFTPTQMNFHSLHDLARWFKENDIPVTEISVGRLCPSGEAIEGWDKQRLTFSDYKYLFGVMREIYRDFGIYAFMGDAFPLCVLPYDDWELIKGCWQGTGFAHVSYTGEMKSCSILSGSYGNVLETPLIEIWTERLKAMRSLAYLPRQCRLCPHFCGGGCSASQFGATHYAPDEFIPKPEEENILTLARRAPGFLNFYLRNGLNRWKAHGEKVSTSKPLPPTTAKPRMNCQFRIRKDIEGYVGFFKGRGILTLDETAVRIVQLMDGQRSIEDIAAEMERGKPSKHGQTRENVLTFLQSINRGEFLAFGE